MNLWIKIVIVLVTVLVGTAGVSLGLYLAYVTKTNPALGFGSFLGILAVSYALGHGLTYSKKEENQ